MKYLHNLIILITIITFSLGQKPKGIRIFNVNYNKNSFYEHTVFKNEEFGFQFTREKIILTPMEYHFTIRQFLEVQNIIMRYLKH